MTPEISVIVPVYNVENYLSRCIDSILAQTFSDFELILVDDGSTDLSGKICDEYEKKDSRIKVIHKENGGVSSARNCGLEKTKGKCLCFVDSDDWISSDYLKYLYFLIDKYNADIVSANYMLVYDEKSKFSLQSKIKVINNTSKILQYYMQQDKIHKKNDFPVWIKLYKKELFNDVKFPIGKIYEDNITNFKILQKCSCYVKTTRIIYAYFQRPHSITKSKLTEKHLALIDSSNEMLNLAGNHKKLIKLCKRKIAMSYFSVLTMYVRYGTDLSEERISEFVDEYKKIKKDFLRTEKSIKIHFISFLICWNIKLCRKIYLRIIGGGGYSCRVIFTPSVSSLQNAEVSYEIAA